MRFKRVSYALMRYGIRVETGVRVEPGTVIGPMMVHLLSELHALRYPDDDSEQRDV